MLELYGQGNLIKNIFRIFGATIKHTQQKAGMIKKICRMLE